MTMVEYISDTQVIVKASLSPIQHSGLAAFKMSKISLLPPPVSSKDLPGGPTQIFNVCRIRRINCHPVNSDEDSAPQGISDTDDWRNWNGDLEHPNDCEDDCTARIESAIEDDTSIENPECPEQQDVRATPNVPRLVRPTCKSKGQAEMVLLTVNAIETRRNNRVQNKLNRMRQRFSSCFMYLDWEL